MVMYDRVMQANVMADITRKVYQIFQKLYFLKRYFLSFDIFTYKPIHEVTSFTENFFFLWLSVIVLVYPALWFGLFTSTYRIHVHVSQNSEVGHLHVYTLCNHRFMVFFVNTQKIVQELVYILNVLSCCLGDARMYFVIITFNITTLQ